MTVFAPPPPTLSLHFRCRKAETRRVQQYGIIWRIGSGSKWLLSSGARLLFACIAFPYHVLSSIISLVGRYAIGHASPRNGDPNLQKRITKLEAEVGRLSVFRPPNAHESRTTSTDPSTPEDATRKISMLETELANTRKVGIINSYI